LREFCIASYILMREWRKPSLEGGVIFSGYDKIGNVVLRVQFGFSIGFKYGQALP